MSAADVVAPGTISGRAYDLDHQPVEGALIQIDGAHSTFTDHSGAFTVDNLGPGLHYVSVELGSGPKLYGPMPAQTRLVLEVDTEPSREYLLLLVLPPIIDASFDAPDHSVALDSRQLANLPVRR